VFKFELLVPAICPAFAQHLPQGAWAAGSQYSDALDLAGSGPKSSQNEIEPNWGTQEYRTFLFTFSIW
jgi:hypothetical protein